MSTQTDIKVVLSDLDGTLLNAQSCLSAKNRHAIEGLSERGIRFGICTGRDVGSILHMVDEWDARDLVHIGVGQNGSEFYDLATGELETNHLVAPDAFAAVIEHFRDLGVNYCIAVDGEYVIPWDADFVHEQAQRGRFRLRLDPDFQEALSQPRAKLHIMCPDGVMPVVRERAASFYDPRVTSVQSSESLYEYMHPDVSKADGVMAAVRHFNLTGPEQIMAFGDAQNDVEMIRDAGVGVAMGNACPEVMRVADYVTVSNTEDGVASFLTEWFNL